ncbi:MAG: hypothetical protein ACOWWH_12635 [Eubacteriaceae bacterium]
MINWERIKTLYQEVGFKQSPASSEFIVDDDNLTSKSTLRFEDVSGIITITNIAASQSEVNINESDFNEYLRDLRKSTVNEVVRNITEDEQDFIQSINLYPYEKTFDIEIDVRGKFVGFIFEPYSSLNYIGVIDWGELSFNEDVTFNIHLFNSNNPNTPIKSIEVSALANQAVIFNMDDFYLSDSDTHKGGTYYIGYFEDDLGTAKAYRKDYDHSNIQMQTKCFYCRPVSLDHTNNVIDITSITNESFSYGLNFGVNIYKDYTELLIRNRRLLSKCIQYKLAEKVIDLILTSSRTNRDNSLMLDENVIKSAQFVLYGRTDLGIEGIQGQLTKLISNIKKSLFYKPLITRGSLS